MISAIEQGNSELHREEQTLSDKNKIEVKNLTKIKQPLLKEYPKSKFDKENIHEYLVELHVITALVIFALDLMKYPFYKLNWKKQKSLRNIIKIKKHRHSITIRVNYKASGKVNT